MVKLILKIVLFVYKHNCCPNFIWFVVMFFSVFFKSRESYSSVHTGNKVITDC